MTEHGLPDPKDPKRVVVIGARGFVGANLTSRLAAEGIDALPLSSQDIDLCDAGAGTELADRLEADDVVVLVSALTPDRGRDIRTLMRNLTMGEQACQALAEGRVAQVVYVSSDAVYADDASPVREDSCCHPSSYHGLMHLTRETMLGETCKAADTPLFIVRPSLLYGALDTHNGYGPNRFMRLAKAGEPIQVFGEGEEQRDHVAVDDVSALIVAGIRRRTAGTINRATGTSVSFRDAAETAIRVTGSASTIEPQPRAVPITHRHFDITNLHRSFPDLAPTSLATGLEQMAVQIHAG